MLFRSAASAPGHVHVDGIGAVAAGGAAAGGAVGLVAGPVGSEGSVLCNGHACVRFMQIVVRTAPPAVEGIAGAVIRGWKGNPFVIRNNRNHIAGSIVIVIIKCNFMGVHRFRIYNRDVVARLGIL